VTIMAMMMRQLSARLKKSWKNPSLSRECIMPYQNLIIFWKWETIKRKSVCIRRFNQETRYSCQIQITEESRTIFQALKINTINIKSEMKTTMKVMGMDMNRMKKKMIFKMFKKKFMKMEIMKKKQINDSHQQNIIIYHFY
jgi:hypothetical protein